MQRGLIGKKFDSEAPISLEPSMTIFRLTLLLAINLNANHVLKIVQQQCAYHWKFRELPVSRFGLYIGCMDVFAMDVFAIVESFNRFAETLRVSL